jgi:hypothetical protein
VTEDGGGGDRVVVGGVEGERPLGDAGHQLAAPSGRALAPGHARQAHAGAQRGAAPQQEPTATQGRGGPFNLAHGFAPRVRSGDGVAWVESDPILAIGSRMSRASPAGRAGSAPEPRVAALGRLGRVRTAEETAARDAMARDISQCRNRRG